MRTFSINKTQIMKRLIPLVLGLAFVAYGCNNEADSVDAADSANEANMNRDMAPMADEASADFLVRAADGGLSEVEAGKLGQEKATNAKVKSFASMMVNDHTAANDKVKSLAASRNINLPNAPSAENAKKVEDLSKKSGAEFDREFMKMTVDDHEKTIDLFEKASGNVNDTEIKAFADNTLPKLKEHLESAKQIRDGLK